MRDESTSAPPYALSSVSNALRLLRLMAEHRQVRVTDAATHLGLASSTAHRLLTTLTHEGFAEQDPTARCYRPGPALVEIGLAAVQGMDIRRTARPHMLELASEINETVHLLVLEAAGVRFIDGVESNHLVRVTSRTGTLLPAHAASGGKLLLAELPPDEVVRLLGNGLQAMTEETISDMAALLKELEEIRKVGYALNKGESDPGLRAVAVGIRDRLGRTVAALAASVPTARGNMGRLRGFVGPLRRTADLISSQI